ncbi:TPA: hypothetical protein ENX78_00955 [Candidatus Poribacteria bacterium]|nr:hypothetical protein [Candidatus Poribacteria bacterium]
MTDKQRIRLAFIQSGFNGEKQSNKLIGMLIIKSKRFFFGMASSENSIVLMTMITLTIDKNPHRPPFCITRITKTAKTMALITLFQNISV